MVTLCIGDNYLKTYNALFRPTQEAYARKCGYDFHVVTDYIGDIKNPDLICLNKYLVCDMFKQYDYVLYIDADIVINTHTAPPIHTVWDMNDTRVGVVNQSQPTLDARHMVAKYNKCEITAIEYYKLAGFETSFDHIINGGMLWMQPRHHAEILMNMYKKYELEQIGHPRRYHFEQSVTGYELQTNNLSTFMDSKWNALWANNKVYYNNILNKPVTLQEFMSTNYFVHLAGHCDFHLVPDLNKMYLN
jgi:lipopolysaccharide biosynthesis glycosyltransferase